MKTLIAILLTLLLHANTVVAEETSAKKSESPWVSQSELDAALKHAIDNRFMLYKVEGKIDSDSLITYKGYFMPYPPGLDRFYAYWGMNNHWYKSRKTSLENAGFKEIWHQSFFDSVQEEVHQAIWLKLVPTTGRQDDDPKGRRKVDGKPQNSYAM